MPDKKRPAEPPWQVILEEIRSQNRATIEAVEATRLSLEQRIERLEQETRSRDSLLEAATRDLRATVEDLRATVEQNGKDIRDLKAAVQENTTDIRDVKVTVRDLVGKVEALTRLEERVAAVEHRLA